MNVLDDEESLMNSFPFVNFGLSTEEGQALVSETGYVNIPGDEQLAMIGRMYHCPEGSTIHIAGSSTVEPVAQEWSKAYMEHCPATNITVEGGGSSNGAGRVCGEEERGEPVEIGNMSREWKDTEAEQLEDGTMQCLVGDTERSAIQVEVSTDEAAGLLPP